MAASSDRGSVARGIVLSLGASFATLVGGSTVLTSVGRAVVRRRNVRPRDRAFSLHPLTPLMQLANSRPCEECKGERHLPCVTCKGESARCVSVPAPRSLPLPQAWLP